MSDRIVLHDMRFRGRDGVEEAERREAQPFGVDVEIVRDLGPAGRSDDLARTVDYGAVFAVWEPGRNTGLGVVDEPGAFCWAELVASDLSRSATFYKSLFGWGTKDDPRYTEWTLGGRSIGGMIQIQKDWGEIPPHWLVYFQVEDCDRSVEKAKGLGAKVSMGPQDFPGVGRIALLNDPQGAHFYVIKLTGLGH